MSTKTKQNEKSSASKSPSFWSRAFNSNPAELPRFLEDYSDAIFLARLVLSIIVGFFWGFVLLRGVIGILLFVIINAGLIYFYNIIFQNVDAFGSIWELTKEDFITATPGALVIWIVIFFGLVLE